MIAVKNANFLLSGLLKPHKLGLYLQGSHERGALNKTHSQEVFDPLMGFEQDSGIVHWILIHGQCHGYLRLEDWDMLKLFLICLVV